ncbi:hypothetical protein [Geobacter sp. FeAm09]|uniref:hypothetical protein n=1 Tax=Geobacter sp. FeAm09 TaxID=2597769 RepID=UPI00197AA386|nr:hypothetical protein [Geobacter sp. FeAm09]
MGIVILSVATAFAGDQMELKSRVRIFKRPDVTSPCFRYLEEGEKVSILSKLADGWLKVGTAHKLESGKQMVGFINPDLPAKKTSVTAGGQPPATIAAPREIALASSVATCDSQLQTLTQQKGAQIAALQKELDSLKSSLAASTATSTEKDKTVAALRAQAADSATKLSGVQNTVEYEAFKLLSEKATTVRLRGFGSVRLVPLLDDYLVVIPPELSNQMGFFSKIRKVVLVGKAGTYLICDRKYFVPAAPIAAAEAGKEVQQ